MGTVAYGSEYCNTLGYSFPHLHLSATLLLTMSILEQRIRQVTEQLTAVLADLVSRDAGIPRPIIGLTVEMPFKLPVHQRAVAALRKIAEENKAEFQEATLHFIVHPNQDPAGKRTAEIPYPYQALTVGEVIDRLGDRSDVKLITIVVKDVPKDWRSERPLDLVIQARSPSRRYGEAIAVAPTINLRVPRFAIPGKETGV